MNKLLTMLVFTLAFAASNARADPPDPVQSIQTLMVCRFINGEIVIHDYQSLSEAAACLNHLSVELTELQKFDKLIHEIRTSSVLEQETDDDLRSGTDSFWAHAVHEANKRRADLGMPLEPDGLLQELVALFSWERQCRASTTCMASRNAKRAATEAQAVASAAPSAAPSTAIVAPAFLNINSLPSSFCFLDGLPLGGTPKARVTVKPGTHTVIFYPETGLSKTVVVTVAAGETKQATAILRD